MLRHQQRNWVRQKHHSCGHRLPSKTQSLQPFVVDFFNCVVEVGRNALHSHGPFHTAFHQGSGIESSDIWTVVFSGNLGIWCEPIFDAATCNNFHGIASFHTPIGSTLFFSSMHLGCSCEEFACLNCSTIKPLSCWDTTRQLGSSERDASAR